MKRAQQAREDGQADIAEIAEGFGWTEEYAALDDLGVVRRQLRFMTRPEFLTVIALKMKKSRQTAAVAARMQDVVDTRPEWRITPDRTLSEILGV